jgi:hypothetical protein
MKKKPEQSTVQQFSLLVAGIVVLFSYLGLGSINMMPFMLVLSLPFLLGALAFYVTRAVTRNHPSSTINRFARALSIIIIMSLAGCCWFAIQSLWISPFDTNTNRFELENIATSLLVVGGFSTLILSALQRDTFWFTKRQRGKLDEREMNERREIFEKSYRYSIALVALTLWGYLGYLDRLPVLREIDNIQGTHLPGHYFLPAYCLIIALVALPPVLATRRKR